MAGRLTDKIAIVTGGASGIGRATVLRFAEEGAKVLAADRNPGGLEQTKSLAQKISPDVETIAVDVSKLDQVSAMVDHAVDHFGRLDVLVNAAGCRIEPPVSVPVAAGVSRAATAAADPPDEPPGEHSRSQGFFTGPK